MAVQTEQVRDLVDFAPEGFLVTSFYLDVNAGEFPGPDSILKSFDSVIHAAESERKDIESTLSHEARESMRGDLARIRDFIPDFRRNDANSLAIFSCSAQDFWQVITLPTATASRVVFGPRPHVAPIAAFLSHTKPTAILLTDRQNARILTMEGGEVREWGDIQDWVPRRSQQGGWSQMRYQRRSDEWAKHHVDHAAELVLALQRHHPFDWLILGTEVEVQHDLERDLHPYLKDLVIGEIQVRLDADLAEIVARAKEVRERAETEHIDRLVRDVQEYAGAGGRGAIGLKDTLTALNEQKVHILLVQQGFTAPGAFCPNCGLISTQTDATCRACNAVVRQVDDVVDIAIQKALELGSVVEVATEQDQLQPIGGIGAILYY